MREVPLAECQKIYGANDQEGVFSAGASFSLSQSN